MIRTILGVFNNSNLPDESMFSDHTIDETSLRVRELLNRCVEQTKEDQKPRTVTVVIGRVPGSSFTSKPKRSSEATAVLGVDHPSLSGIVDLALRRLHHPSIESVRICQGAGVGFSSSVLEVVDKLGQRFRINITKVKEAKDG
jgi:hypothetical protein